MYLNHSCTPSVEIHLYEQDAQGCFPDGVAGEVLVLHDRDLSVGDDMTFFYPSTEWDVAAPFQCMCGAGERCLGEQRGSMYMPKDKLDLYFINQHVKDLQAREE